MTGREREYIRIFHEVALAITSLDSLKEVLARVVREMAKALGAMGASVRLLDPQRGELVLLASYGLKQEYLEKGQVVASKSIADTLKGQTVWIEDAVADPRVAFPEDNRREGIRSILSVPMALDGRVTGALRLYFSEPRRLDANDIRFAEALATQAAIGVGNARIFENLKREYQEVVRGVASIA